MTCANEASPSINSASPGAFGSTDTAEMVGDDAAKSTTTTFALRAIRRAIVSAVNVMLSLAAVPRTVILRAAAPASRKSSARRSISEKLGNNVRSGRSRRPQAQQALALALALALARLWLGLRLGHRGGNGCEQQPARGPLRGADVKAATARGAVMRNNSPVTIAPAESIRVANVAISTIGSFFGYAGLLDTLAREMIRPSAGAASMFSRVLASRYFAR